MNRYKTPLRYPGGKQKLAPFVREIIIENELSDGEYAEPYAGGAGVGIALLLNGDVKKIHLNDASTHVFSFWNAVLNHTEQLCRRIVNASLTVDEWKRQREIFRRSEEFGIVDVGFSAFFLNRCNRSGIFDAGIIGGYEQKGKWKIDARFSANDLIHRIESIALQKKMIRLRNWDAERFIKDYVPRLPKKSLVYCDPPYFEKSERLYLHRYDSDDHRRIAKLVQSSIKRPWIVSYDFTPEIMRFYEKCRSFVYKLQYNAGDVYKGKEVFIFSDRLKIPAKSCLGFIDRSLVGVSD